MGLDLTTILALDALVLVVCGTVFILDTALRKNDVVGRIWSVAFIAGILTTFAYLVWGFNQQTTWWAIAIGNGALAAAVGAMWVGNRVYNGRTRSLAWAAAAGSLLNVAAVLLEGPEGGDWAGAEMLFLSVGALALAGAVEALRGRLGRSTNARMLAFALGVAGLFYVARAGAYMFAGESSALFTEVFGSGTTTLVTIGLVIVATVTMSVLRAEHVGTRRGVGSTVDAFSGDRVLRENLFTELAIDRLQRADFHQSDLVLVEADLDDLAELNLALGRNPGDSAISHFGRVLRLYAPAEALVGELGAGRFAVLFDGSIEEAKALLESVQAALIDAPFDRVHGIRSTGSFGVAHTGIAGYEFADLKEAASQASRTARAAGGNRVEIVDEIAL